MALDLNADRFDMPKIRRPYTINGIEIWITGESEQEVADKYAVLRFSTSSETKSRSEKHNFTEFYVNNWQYIIQTVSGSTAKDYQRYMSKHILPFFGSMNIEDIRWRDVQRFYDIYKGFAHSTVHKWKIVLSRLLQIAIGDGIVSSDPTKDDRLVHTKLKNLRPVPQPQEYKEILGCISSLDKQHERLYMAIVGYSGLRKGEVLGLKWSDVNFSEDIISVKRAVNTDRSSKKASGIIKSPKSAAGVRNVPLIAPLEKILLENRHSSEYIVTDLKTNFPVHTHATFVAMWHSIKKQMNLGIYTSHSFRHAMCTMLLSSGVDIKEPLIKAYAASAEPFPFPFCQRFEVSGSKSDK